MCDYLKNLLNDDCISLVDSYITFTDEMFEDIRLEMLDNFHFEKDDENFTIFLYRDSFDFDWEGFEYNLEHSFILQYLCSMIEKRDEFKDFRVVRSCLKYCLWEEYGDNFLTDDDLENLIKYIANGD